jgi:hypothetical protein
MIELIERFHQNAAAYRSGRYNETQVRVEFINPFFEALGWDMQNKRGLPPDQQEVIHEHALKPRTAPKLEGLPLFQLLDNRSAAQAEANPPIDDTEAFRAGGGTKAPDYGFRIDGQRKFFLTAKKPAVNIKGDIHPAFQLRRYGWSANLPLSILTDFEDFAVYDCRIRPEKTDKAAVARMMYVSYTEYADKWDDITKLFSCEAVLSGSLDTYAQPAARMRKGLATVDAAFLKEIEDWRAALAHNIAVWNTDLNQRELNHAVQMTIDRIIFLRICEDRGIEPYGRLQALYDRRGVYAALSGLFRQADDRYNSGLFHFKPEKGRSGSPDNWTLKLHIEDEPLQRIIKHLYYPDSPYEFSVLPIELLGQVYEQFLGKVIHLSAERRAVVEEKPEVRKAGGVFYTPSYIVDYIVKHTIGKLLEGKTPRQASKLKILDPSCGSGSFLIGAYQYLLDWHREYYLDDGPQKHKKALYQAAGGVWRLTTAERRRILLNNIYGVDIDTQAVEVTKLSLLLKVLEGETEQALTPQLRLLQERALPDLGSNIKWGNSLIGPDIYQIRQTTFLDEAEQRRINAFDWQTEFREIMQAGGFDAVIGNPPYIRIQTMKEWAPVEVEHYKQRYVSASKGNYDIYVLFVERGLSLLNQHGRLGYILPNKFFNAQYGELLRSLIAQDKYLSEIVDFGDQQVFAGVTTYTCVLLLDKSGNDTCTFAKVDNLPAWRATGKRIASILSAANISSDEWNFEVGEAASLLAKLDTLPTRLRDVASRIFQGIIPGADKVYSVQLLAEDGNIGKCFSRALNDVVYLELELLRNIVSGAEVRRYVLKATDSRVMYPYTIRGDQSVLIAAEHLAQHYPLAFQYFQQTQELLNQRDRGSAKGSEWYKYIRRQNISLQPLPKLAVPRLVSRLKAGYDQEGLFCLDNVDVGGIILCDAYQQSYLYILGLLNSRLINFYFIRNSVPFRGGFYSANRQYIEGLPIRPIDRSSSANRACHDQMLELVERMLGFHKQLTTVKTSYDQDRIKRQIDATDQQIDRLVYELYELTAEEIEIVEASAGR